MLIPSALIAFASLLATLVMLSKKHYENAFTRACVTAFYLFLTFVPTTPIESARELARWFWLLVFGVEVVWWIVNFYMQWRRKKK